MKIYNIKSNTNTSFEIPQYFFSYEKSDENYHYFNVRFSALQSDIAKNSLQKVEVFLQKNYKNLTKTANSKKTSNNFQHIENRRSLHRDQAQSAEAKQNSILFETSVNFSGYVDSNVINLLKSGVNPDDIQELVKDYFTIQPVRGAKNSYKNSLTKEEVRVLNLDLLQKHSIDPSKIFINSNKDFSIHKRSLETFYTQNCLSSLKKDIQYFERVKKKTSLDRIYFRVPISVNKKFLQQTHDFNLAFYLYVEGNNLPVKIETRSVNLNDYINLNQTFFSTPFLEFYNGKISIKQTPRDGSDSYTLYKKEIDSSGNISKYSVCKQDNLFSNDVTQFSVLQKKDTIEIYRCSSRKSSFSLNGGWFSSVVSCPQHFKIDPTALLVGFYSSMDFHQGKLKITLINNPPDAAQFKIIRRENITHDAFGQEVIVTNYRNFDSGSTLIVDETAQAGKIYKYTVFYKMVDGTIKESVTQIYHNIGRVSSAVSTEINQVSRSVVDGEHTVSFVIETDFRDSDLDKIKARFRDAGIFDEFRYSFFNSKEDFSKLFSHQVFRLNKKTGTRELFYDDSPAAFARSFYDQKKSRQKFLISPIDPMVDYCYEVCVSLRDPSTLLKNEIVSSNTKTGNFIKNYTYSPYKWRQPSTLRNGTLFAQDYNGDVMLENSLLEDGMGLSAVININSKKEDMKIDFDAKRVDLDKVKLTLNMRNSVLTDYDHFVLIKEVGTIRRIIGTFFSNSIMDRIGLGDSGSLIYYIVPIYSDFSVGNSVRSDTILVRPEEFSEIK